MLSGSEFCRARILTKAFDGGALMQSHLCNRDGEGTEFAPILLAVLTGDIEILRLLIAAGADVNAVWE